MSVKANGSGGGWLRGKTVRKAGGASSNTHSRALTPQVQPVSAKGFNGPIKDPSGRTPEFFVC